MLNFINILLALSQKMGYLGVAFLMTVESSFIPFPSEIVIPPAAYLAQKGEMNIFLVILAGITGSLLGALINYFLARTLGRKIIYSLARHRFARFILINEKKIEISENYFLKYGSSSTFIGRLVPVVRQLISIPAGFSKMSIKKFLFFTFLGSSLWITILAALGYFLGSNQELLEKYYKEISIAAIIAAIIFVLYIFLKIVLTKKETKNS